MKPILCLNTGCRLSGTCPELRCLAGPDGGRPSGYTWADATVGWSWSVRHPHNTVGRQPGPVRVSDGVGQCDILTLWGVSLALSGCLSHDGWDVPHLMFPLHQSKPSNVTQSKGVMLEL